MPICVLLGSRGERLSLCDNNIIYMQIYVDVFPLSLRIYQYFISEQDVTEAMLGDARAGTILRGKIVSGNGWLGGTMVGVIRGTLEDWIVMRCANLGLCDEVSVRPWVDGMYCGIWNNKSKKYNGNV